MQTTDHQLSFEATRLERSVMRDLIRRTAQPGIISLSGGLPPSDYLPADDLRDCFDAVLRREGGDALQYRPAYPPLLEWIAEYMRGRGVDCAAEDVFITNGNQQGLALLSRLFVDPGQTAVMEKVTFTGIQQVTQGRGVDVLAVPTDLTDGVDTDALEEAFRQSPRLAFLIPDFHNPLGVTASTQKREHIAELAARYNVPVVEDDPYSALRFSGERIPPIKAYDESGHIFYMGSFSKMLAPTLRMGWMIAPSGFMTRLNTLRESFDLETSALSQRVVAEYLGRGLLEGHLGRMNVTLKTRADLMLNALDTHFGDVATWTKPEGGLFIWLTFNDTKMNTWELFESALAKGVAFVPGGAFGGTQNTLRLNFSKVDADQIEEGLRRLAMLVKGN